MSKKIQKLLKGVNKTKAIMIVAVLLVVTGASAYYFTSAADQAPPQLEPDQTSELYKGFTSKDVRTKAGMKEFLVYEEGDKDIYQKRVDEFKQKGFKPTPLDFHEKNLGVNYMYLRENTSLEDIVHNINPESVAIAVGHYSAEQGKWYVTPNTYYSTKKTIRTLQRPGQDDPDDAVYMNDLEIEAGAGIAVVTLNKSDMVEAGNYAMNSPVDYPICDMEHEGWYLYGINEDWVDNIKPCFNERVRWVWAITPEWYELNGEYENFRKIYTTSDDTHTIMNLVNHDIEKSSLVWVYLEAKPAEKDDTPKTPDCPEITAETRFREILREYIEDKDIIDTDKKIMTAAFEQLMAQSGITSDNRDEAFKQLVDYIRAENYILDIENTKTDVSVVTFTVPKSPTESKTENFLKGMVVIHMIEYTPAEEECPTWALRYLEKPETEKVPPLGGDTETESEDDEQACAQLPDPELFLQALLRTYVSEQDITDNQRKIFSSLLADLKETENYAGTITELFELLKNEIIADNFSTELISKDNLSVNIKVTIPKPAETEGSETSDNTFEKRTFKLDTEIIFTLVVVNNSETGCDEWAIRGYNILLDEEEVPETEVDGGEPSVGFSISTLDKEIIELDKVNVRIPYVPKTETETETESEPEPENPCGDRYVDYEAGELCDSSSGCFMATDTEIQGIRALCASKSREKQPYVEAGWCIPGMDYSTFACTCLPDKDSVDGVCIDPEPADEVEEMLPESYCGDGNIDGDEECDGGDHCMDGEPADQTVFETYKINCYRLNNLVEEGGTISRENKYFLEWCNAVEDGAPCLCEWGYEPSPTNSGCYKPAATEALPAEICGDGILNGDEQCDGGEYCVDIDIEDLQYLQRICAETSLPYATVADFRPEICTIWAQQNVLYLCLCYDGYEPDPENPGSCKAMPSCGNGIIEQGETCDGGLYCLDGIDLSYDNFLATYVLNICNADFDPDNPEEVLQYNYQQEFKQRYPEWCEMDTTASALACECYPGAEITAGGNCVYNTGCGNGEYDLLIPSGAEGLVTTELCDYSSGATTAAQCCEQNDTNCTLRTQVGAFQDACTCPDGMVPDGKGGCVLENLIDFDMSVFDSEGTFVRDLDDSQVNIDFSALKKAM